MAIGYIRIKPKEGKTTKGPMYFAAAALSLSATFLPYCPSSNELDSHAPVLLMSVLPSTLAPTDAFLPLFPDSSFGKLYEPFLLV